MKKYKNTPLPGPMPKRSMRLAFLGSVETTHPNQYERMRNGSIRKKRAAQVKK